MNAIRGFYLNAARRVETNLAWLPPLLARLTLGWVFVESGWGKLHHLDKIVAFFTELGIPAPQLQAPMVATIELVGGVLLLLGLATRLAALPLSATMVVAIATARWADLNEFSDLLGFIEYLYLVMFVYLAVFGPGALSVDAWVHKRQARTQSAVVPQT